MLSQPERGCLPGSLCNDAWVNETTRPGRDIKCKTSVQIALMCLHQNCHSPFIFSVLLLWCSLFRSLVAMLMTQWEFRIVPCLAGGNSSATCLKMLVMRFADVQWPAPLHIGKVWVWISCSRRSINVRLILLLRKNELYNQKLYESK